jgi:hypothetical protein
MQKSICILIMGLCLSVMTFAAIIQNPSFEGSFVNGVASQWTPYNGPSLGIGTVCHQGTKSQQMRIDGYGYMDFGPFGIYQVLSDLQPGQNYIVSVWASRVVVCDWAPYWGQSKFGVGINQSGINNPRDPSTIWASSNPWTDNGGPSEGFERIDIRFAAQTTTAVLFLELQGWGDGSDPWTSTVDLHLLYG